MPLIEHGMPSHALSFPQQLVWFELGEFIDTVLRQKRATHPPINRAKLPLAVNFGRRTIDY